MRLVLYYADGDVLETPANEGFDPLKIWSLLNRLKEESGADYRVIDVSAFSQEEIFKAYESAVVASVWNRYRIRKVFGTNSSSASFFGKGVPALMVFEGDKPVQVFPHEQPSGDITTIRAYLESQLHGNLRGAELARDMDDLRKAIGPIGTSTSQLVREGRRR